MTSWYPNQSISTRIHRKSEKYMDMETTITLVIVEKNQKSKVRHTNLTISYRSVVILPSPIGIHKITANIARTSPTEALTMAGRRRPRNDLDKSTDGRGWASTSV
ncbi:hypothetical protein PF010_g3983 [Phytophthora fragariae]|uniref:Uncharacterized protein n=1 Tax=Phytophthora fragariae TaxID=53985 RepID=A0A6G0LT82_9STRA|nr:hypothetical protein PF010_g3983 [Phytophthora fragariae]KAE9249083.1 hypothetical protein PF004_g3554 [Phytophthora fragariae]